MKMWIFGGKRKPGEEKDLNGLANVCLMEVINAST